MKSFVDELQEIDDLMQKRSKQLLDSLDEFFAIQQELSKLFDIKPKQEDPVKKALKQMQENTYWENLQFKKELKKNARKYRKSTK